MINKDLYGLSESEFANSLNTNFIPDDFDGKLEWALLLLQEKFAPARLTPYLPDVNASTFNNAFLLINDDIKFLNPFLAESAGPNIFKEINIKSMTIGKDGIQLQKLKELNLEEKRHVSFKNRNKYIYKHDLAYYKSDTEKFYSLSSGYTCGDDVFNKPYKEITQLNFINPIELNGNYKLNGKTDVNELAEIYLSVKMAYSIALSMYYEWTLLLKDNKSIRITIPFNPNILKEMFATSMLKFESRKKFIHFVTDHYRRLPNKSEDDYSVYVKKYLRGENKFNHNGFEAIVQPPQYDLNRIKSNKKFEQLF